MTFLQALRRRRRPSGSWSVLGSWGISLESLLVAVVLVWASAAVGADEMKLTSDEALGIPAEKRDKHPYSGGVEDESAREQKSRTFEFEDGRRITVVYPASVNYREPGAEGDDKKDGEGGSEYKPIDNTLEEDDGGYRNKANRYRLKLPDSLEDRPVRVSLGESWISYALIDAKAEGDVDGTEAEYKNALPHVDVRYRAASDAVKEELVLQNKNAQREFRFRLDTSPDLEPREADGRIEFIDRDGRLVMAFDAPFMEDASGTLDGFSDDVTLRLDKDDAGRVVVLRASDSFLDDPARKFPVTLDPTTRLREGHVKDCFIASGGSQDNSHCGSDTLKIGYDGADNRIKRGLVKFNAKEALPPNQEVLNAELTLHRKNGASTPDPQLFGVHRVTRNWSPNTATWNRADTDTPWLFPGGDYDPVPADGEATREDNNYRWYPTDVVQDWADDKSQDDAVPDDYGLLVRGPTSGNTQLDADSSDSSNQGNWPQLIIEHADRVGVLRQYPFHEEALSDRMGLKVNLGTGNLVFEAGDLGIAGTAGHDLEVGRFYNSRSTRIGDFGKGWTMSTGSDVYIDELRDGSVAFYGPSGYVVRFQKKEGGFQAPPGLKASLVKNDTGGGYTLQFDQSGSRYVFDDSGLLTRLRDQDDNTIIFTYTAGKVSAITDTQNRQVTFERTNGLVTRMVDVAGGRQYRYGYNAQGQLTSYTDPAGKLTEYTYADIATDDGPRAVLKTIKDPRSNLTVLEYDTKARVGSLGRDDGTGRRPIEFNYDADRTSTCQDDAPQGVIVTDPRTNKTTYCADNRDRVRKVFDARGHSHEASWTPTSNLASSQSGTGSEKRTTHGYSSDGRDNLISVSPPESDGVQVDYDDADHPDSPTSVKNNNGTRYNYSYEGPRTNPRRPGHLVKIRQANSATPQVQLAYDAQGNVISSRDGNDNLTTYAYNGGNLTKITPPAPLGATTITYDALSRPRTMRDGKGQTTTTDYDALDRVVKQTFQDGSTVSYVYDANGNMTSRQDANGASNFGYDKLNRPTYETKPTGTTSYAYDPNGNLRSATAPGGTITYDYDATNFLKTMVEPGNFTTRFETDNDGNRKKTIYPNGVVIDNDFDNADRLKSIITRGPAGNVLKKYAYDYVINDRKTDLRDTVTDESGRTTFYTYDPLERLTQAKTKGAAGNVVTTYDYTYDNATNRTSQAINGSRIGYTYNAANQLTNDTTGKTYTYDANGNETARSDKRRYTYNAKDQTASITTPGLIETTTAFKYHNSDQNERTHAGDKRFHNDARGVTVEEGLAAGVPIPGDLDNIYYNRDPGGTLVSQRSDTGREYLVYDGLGSVVALTDESGAVVRRRDYDPYGKTTGTSGASDIDTAWQYTGQYADPTGLYKMGRRYYDPAIGRWTQQDPLIQAADPLQSNRYLYTSGNPINLTDPAGLCAFDRDVRPTWFTRGGYTYMELCFRSGRRAGTRAGYLRVDPGISPQGRRSLAGKIARISGGYVLIGVGISVGVACTAATGGIGVLHCGVAASGPGLAGAMLVITGARDILEDR